MKYCALCCIARDEDFYIEEWVDYHLLLGFDKIILYDNHSVVSLNKQLFRYIQIGNVEVNSTEGNYIGTKAQGLAYTHCFNTYRNDYVWIGVIDSDEMIVLHKHDNIKEFLSEFENYGGIFLNWVMYGNPNMFKRSTHSMISNYIFKSTIRNTTGKSIVRPARVKDFKGPHGPNYLYPYYSVNTEHFPLEPCVYSAQYCIDSAQVNHFNIRSKEDYDKKVARWNESAHYLNAPSFEDATKNFTILDDELIRIYNKLKEKRHYNLPTDFDSIAQFTDCFLKLINLDKYSSYLEEWLCNCVCKFPDEPLIWLFRSMLARKKHNPTLALHYIKQAFKFSGSSALFYELSEIYAQLGDEKRRLYAQEQAIYKKHVEDTTCG